MNRHLNELAVFLEDRLSGIARTDGAEGIITCPGDAMGPLSGEPALATTEQLTRWKAALDGVRS